jgi:hypothetical protein
MIEKEGFPAGVMVGRNRLWPEEQIDAWIASRPSAKSFLRGRAKQLAAAKPTPAPAPQQEQQVDLEDLL